MRRTFHIFISLTLVLATTGMSISKHYCGNSLVRTNLGVKAKSCMPDMDMGSGCCDEKTETLVLDDDFQVTKSNIKIAPEFDLLVEYLVTELSAYPQKLNNENLIPLDTGPPDGSEPLYITVQSFLL
jgi:hypothetical protein